MSGSGTTIRVQMTAPAIEKMLGGLDPEVSLDIARGTYANLTRKMIEGMGAKELGDVHAQIRECYQKALQDEMGLRLVQVKEGWSTVEKLRLGPDVESRLKEALRERADVLLKDAVAESVAAVVEKQFEETKLDALIRRKVSERITAIANAALKRLSPAIQTQLHRTLVGALTAALKAGTSEANEADATIAATG